MNCRRVCGLLSAYIDRELTPEEIQQVENHLDSCPSCRLEEEALSCTKKLVAGLAARTPRQELETLLSLEAQRLENPNLRERVTALVEELGYVLRTPLLPKPLAVTAALSLAGLWLATTTLDGPRDWDMNPAMLNALPPSEMPVTVLVFSQAPTPPVYTGAPGAETVAWPMSHAQGAMLPSALGVSRDGQLSHRGVFIRAAYPRPLEWQPVSLGGASAVPATNDFSAPWNQAPPSNRFAPQNAALLGR